MNNNYENLVQLRIIVSPHNTSQAMEHCQPISINSSKLQGDKELKVKIGDIINQIKKPISDKVRNYMVSYFCHRMKSFVYIGHNQQPEMS